MYRKILVAPLPDPVGGVTTYSSRLVGIMGDELDGVVDLYPNKLKVYKSSNYKVSPLKFPYSLFWFFAKYLMAKKAVYHLNFSTVMSLAAFAFIPKLRNKWMITLHNGALKIPTGLIASTLINKLVVRKIDLFLAINENQSRFYREELNIPESKVILHDSYIPVFNSPPVIRNSCLLDFTDKFPKYILANGYVKPIYNFEILIEFAKENPDIGVLIIAYGERDMSYSKMLEKQIEDLSNVCIFEAVSQSTFLSLLNGCTVYVRPNKVDSFGIAVADAINFGISVVATNVCRRYPGTIIVDVNKPELFKSEINRALKIEVKNTQNLEKKILDKKYSYLKLLKNWDY